MIVGLSGRIGSGKDVAAQVLVREFGFTILRFSDELKMEVFTRLRRTLGAHLYTSYPMKWDQLDDEGRDREIWALLTERKDAVTRALLQEYGTDVRRADDPEYWVQKWRNRLVGLRYSGVEYVVVPDVRFVNEVQAIQAEGGVLVRIERPGNPGLPSAHSSETELDRWQGWAAVLINDRSQEVFEERVRSWAFRIGLKNQIGEEDRGL